jgi:hypothetical protein
MIRLTPWFLVLCCAGLFAQQPELVSVQKIHDQAAYQGSTDLVRFSNLFFCAFREGMAAQGPEGRIRIVISSNGKTWVPYAEVAEAGVDLRAPKLEVTPDGKRLYLLCEGVGAARAGELNQRPRFSTSSDGKVWTPPQKLLAQGDWLWRATLHPSEKKFHGTVFNPHPTTGGPKPEPEWSLKTYTSNDGSVWQLSSLLQVPGQPNESVMRFLRDGRAVVLLRRDGGDKRGAIGMSSAPYRDWKFAPLPVLIQGPNLIELDDGSLIAASRGRGTTPGAHLILSRLVLSPLSFEPVLELPSGGDCGDPGMVWHENHLWVSYHSSHEGKTSIYVAKLRLPWVKSGQ